MLAEERPPRLRSDGPEDLQEGLSRLGRREDVAGEAWKVRDEVERVVVVDRGHLAIACDAEKGNDDDARLDDRQVGRSWATRNARTEPVAVPSRSISSRRAEK